MGKRERESWLLCLFYIPGVLWLLCGYSSQCHGFVCSLWLWYSLTIFECHSCEQRWLWRVCTFAWSSLSLRHSSKFSCRDSNGDWMPFCASSEGSGEFAHLHRLTLAFVTVQNLLCCLKWRFVCYSRQQRILWRGCTFAQTKSLDNVIKNKSILGVCTFAQARLSLLHSIDISCAGWNDDFCNVFVNSECCGESALTTTGILCNHQCVYRCFKNAPSAL